MKAIGRILACVLLAAALVKNVLTTSAANIEFSIGRSNKIVRSNITRLNLVSEQPVLSPDNQHLRTILKDMFKDENKQAIEPLEESRTFGHKRIQFMLMPMMYKMGVMMTMLMILIAISVKGLVIGVILLVLKLSTFLAKFQSGGHAAQPWSQQPIHVHVHNGYPHAHPHTYHSWEMSGPGDDDHYYYKG